jgi:hypothetical protein
MNETTFWLFFIGASYVALILIVNLSLENDINRTMSFEFKLVSLIIFSTVISFYVPMQLHLNPITILIFLGITTFLSVKYLNKIHYKKDSSFKDMLFMFGEVYGKYILVLLLLGVVLVKIMRRI